MNREDILKRYRDMRAISQSHHHKALSLVSRDTILVQAKRLGLAQGNALVVDSDEEMTLVFDLVLYTARPGRSRPLDRLARSARLQPDSDEATLLEALRNTRFSIWAVARRHETVGLVITDTVREADTWLVDENLEATAPDGMLFAGRVCDVDDFVMSCGVIVPLNRDLVEEAMAATMTISEKDPNLIAQDPRFAEAFYRAAIDSGMMSNIGFQ